MILCGPPQWTGAEREGPGDANAGRADAGREREGMWADAGRDRDHAGLPGDVDCRSLGFLPACRAQAQALLLIIRVLFIIRPGAAGAPLLVLLIIRLLFIIRPRAAVYGAAVCPRAAVYNSPWCS